MKKGYIFIYAYIAGNLGDDLMVRCLCERYPKEQFVLCADGYYAGAFRDIKNLTFYDQSGEKAGRWNRFWKKIKGTDDGFRKMLIRMAKAVVHIGGSIFVQHFDDYSLLYQADEQLRRLSRRIYVVGANFGPYSDENYYRQYHELLGRYDGVVFRDEYSRQLFADLTNVSCAPDVVFNYNVEALKQEKKQVLMSVISMEGRNDKFAISAYGSDYREFMIKLSKAYIEEGYEVKYISFCQMQQDEEAIRQIREALTEEERGHTDCCFYRGDNLETCIEAYDEAEIVVGTRVHSIILAELKGKKMIPIIYDLKTLHTLESQEIRRYYRLEELKNVDIRMMMEQAERLPEEKKKQLQNEAARQFKYLEQIL